MSEVENLITNEVQACLKKVLQKLDVDEYSVELSQENLKGNHFMGVITKAKIIGKNCHGQEIVLNVVIKSAPRNETFRKVASVPVAYKREIYVYEKVLREFDTLQREKRVLEPFRAYPKYYGSTLSEMKETIIMEDLIERGFRLHNAKQPVNYVHARLILIEYAKLHALSFAMRLHKPDVFRELSENTQERMITAPDFDSYHSGTLEQSKKVLTLIDPIQEKSLYEKYEKFHENMVDHVKSVLRSDLSNSQCVISHVDCWINNFLFKYDSSGGSDKPIGVRILDWQTACYGSPALDVGYFIFVCTDKELRDKHYSDLIKIYYKTFSDFLTELGGDPQRQFSFEDFQEHLKKYSVFGVYTALLILLIAIGNNEEVLDVQNVSKAEDFELKYDSKKDGTYNRRIKDVLIDFDRLGYNFFAE